MRSTFAVGTGRCGTQLLARLFATDSGVSAHHELNPLNEAFRRYCLWNQLPVDRRGFLDIKRGEIDAACIRGQSFFEASAYLSLSIVELYQAFGSRFILMTRDPVDTVNSLWVKGWYDRDYARDDPQLAIGFHDFASPVHVFSRLVPNGNEFEQWRRLSRIGKLAWYWRTIHERMLAQFSELPADAPMIVRLEDFDYFTYQRVARFIGASGSVSESGFNEICHSRPGALWRRHSAAEWTPTELSEFAAVVTPVAAALGYETDFATRCVSPRTIAVQEGEQQPVNQRDDGLQAPIADWPVSPWLAPGSILFTLPDAPSWLEDAAWAVRSGIDGFRVDQARVAPLWDLIAAVDLGARYVAVLVDADRAGGPWEPFSRLTGLEPIAVATPADRAADLAGLRSLTEAPVVAIPRMMSPAALLRWPEFLRSAPAVVVAWTRLMRWFHRDDLDYWIRQHYEEAFRRQIAIVLELDGLAFDPESEGLFVWGLRCGLSLSVVGSLESSTWRGEVAALITLRDGVRAAAQAATENGAPLTASAR